MRPKASVIVTAKNEQKSIEACMMALKNQTFKDFEIILSDAKSRDKTVKIASKYADRITVKKTNVSEGRNLGAEMAKGDIFVFVDADTILLPDTLEKVMKAFRERGTIGATCSALPLSAEGKYVGTYMFYNSFCKASIRMRKPHVAGFFCAYRRKQFEEVEGFDGNVGILEDYHLSRRIGKLGKIKFVQDALVMTSHRRLKAWGLKMPGKYMHAWLKLLATGRSFSHEWYKTIR